MTAATGEMGTQKELQIWDVAEIVTDMSTVITMIDEAVESGTAEVIETQ